MVHTSTQKKQNDSIEKSRLKCRKKFLYYFPKAFKDQTYLDWERDYKWNAHLEWESALNKEIFEELLTERNYFEIASRAIKIETRTNLLFSFEKMALRDAVRTSESAQLFAQGLFDYVYGKKPLHNRFENFVETVAALPRKQTRVLTWPLVTVFGFIGKPDEYIFLKPNVSRSAAEKYKFDFHYSSRPSWEVYQNFLEFAAQVQSDLADWKPRDMIDIQSFIWVMGSDEYPW
jgi:hypothetical protein